MPTTESNRVIRLDNDDENEEKEDNGDEEDDENTFDDLNPIDLRKKQIIKSLKSRVSNNPVTTKTLSRQQLVNMTSHDKAKQLLMKSHQTNYNSATSLSLTQSLNVAKLEQQARVQAFEAAKKAKQQQQQNEQSSESTKKSNEFVSKPPEQTSSGVRPQAKPSLSSVNVNSGGARASSSDHQLSKPTHQFKQVNNRLRNGNNNAEKPSEANSDLTSLKNSTEITAPDKNDIVGNILCQMNKQNLINPPNVNQQKQQNQASHNEMFTIENYFFRILKCTYSWLIEQGLSKIRKA